MQSALQTAKILSLRHWDNKWGENSTAVPDAAHNHMVAMLRKLSDVDPSRLQGMLKAAAQAGLSTWAHNQRLKAPTKHGGVMVLTLNQHNQMLNGLAPVYLSLQHGGSNNRGRR